MVAVRAENRLRAGLRREGDDARKRAAMGGVAGAAARCAG